ncbi:hypothetical protein F2Q70_00003315 [Brassica cretica]|uniref:Uncharacterized protein n=1 Tax=Brassica cretica TaxID=69181 RepID=A0A8S9IPZ1_BRACR|nr:hypothetical protein F2Q70_00003315 [Brassica cretica]
MSPSEAMMELRSATAKLKATVKTEHIAGPEHGRRLGWWFTVARRFDYDSCDGEKRRLRSFRKWIHGVVRAWLIPVMARIKKNKTNRACRGEASRDEASRSQVTTNPFSRPQGPFAEESRSRPCVNETPREFRRPSSREEMGRGRVSSK